MSGSAQPALKVCPSCKNDVADLLRVDTGMKLALQSVEYPETIYDAVCSDCYELLSSLVSQGAKLRAQKVAKDENRRIIWRRRIDLIKKAQEEVQNKNMKSAAIYYEKYLASLAAGFDTTPGEIVPSLFQGQNFRKELLLVAIAYWDLYRIFDQAENSDEKFQHVKSKLKLFGNLPVTRPTIVRKLRNYLPAARDVASAHEVLRLIDKAPIGACFIATAAFESRSATEVRTLSQFRDDILKGSSLGRTFIFVYYKISPSIAIFLNRFPFIKKPVRIALRAISFILSSIFNLNSH